MPKEGSPSGASSMLALLASLPAAPLARGPAKNAPRHQGPARRGHLPGNTYMRPASRPCHRRRAPPPSPLPPPGPPLPTGYYVNGTTCEESDELAKQILRSDANVSCPAPRPLPLDFCHDALYGKIVSALCPKSCKACDTYCHNNNKLMQQLSKSLANMEPPRVWPAYCGGIFDEVYAADTGSGSGFGPAAIVIEPDDLWSDPLYMIACPAVSNENDKPMSPKCVPGAGDFLAKL